MEHTLRVAIVGGGPAGLAGYWFLKHHVAGVDVTIYEPHQYTLDGDQRLGGGYGIAPNGGSRHA